MNKLVKNRMIIISISLALLVLINIAVSYSYYLGKVVGNETTTTLSFTSAGVIIEYENNSGSISDTNIIPGWSTTKNFKVKSTMKANEGNNNDSKLGYAVKMIVDSNDFPTNSIAYSLAQGSKTGNGQAMENATDVGIATGVNSDGVILGTGYFVVGENEHNYTLTIKYMDSQTVDGNKNFGIHLVVETIKPVTVTVDLNGGAYIGSTTKYIPLGMAVNIEEPTKEGYVFNGWKITSGDGDGSIVDDKIIANSLELTVQAQYRLPNFGESSWATIVANIRKDPTFYNIGDTKEIELVNLTNKEAGSNGLFTVRVANNSTPESCKQKGFSQTACGFVVEFVDIVCGYAMNPRHTNVGGWPDTILRTYLNKDFITFLPTDLQSIILDTIVVSGHGSSDTGNRADGNWESTDKLYLLSSAEVWINGVSYDTAITNTRQLDYYKELGVSTSNNSGAVKYFGNYTGWWWLRTADSRNDYDSSFLTVFSDGVVVSKGSSVTNGGVAPAFRIG